MDSFFDFIFGNLFFVIIIVAAIINFFNSAKKEEEKKRRQQQQRQQRRTNQPEQTRQQQEQKERKMPTFSDLQDQLKEQLDQFLEPEEKKTPSKKEKQSTIGVDHATETLESIEEQRQKQYERLRSQYQSQSNEEDVKEDLSALLKPKKAAKQDVSIAIEKKLTREGIVEGIIMAEVLGPPRALKPYDTNPMNRRRR
ncbi:MAG TPA: hypothetical protein H9895_00990 [Candidatus Pseudogracilibacillus intestinigallinarum]|uniref:Uncharacterized protein n=1 Tax=Candidatus Pseudogracilibacillus intestinigallinarum TaxID=2838742 RepID=A0A9D1PLK5_9BACI|nr:hypothetical protein [Candidatus Pseudogracilibacillus intestinigallinarum]